MGQSNNSVSTSNHNPNTEGSISNSNNHISISNISNSNFYASHPKTSGNGTSGNIGGSSGRSSRSDSSSTIDFREYRKNNTNDGLMHAPVRLGVCIYVYMGKGCVYM